jgi:hypothetical protein
MGDLACPHGFVIPDVLSSPDNVYINQSVSNCALSCYNPPFFRDDEYRVISSTERYSAVVGACFSMLVVVLWCRDQAKRKRFFAILYGSVITCVLVFFSISSAFGRKRFCRNNANFIDGSDGVTLCGVEGAMLIFSVVICATSFCMQSFEVFRQLVLDSKSRLNRLYSGLVVVGVPLVCACSGMAVGAFGIITPYTTCMEDSTSIYTLFVGVLPVSVFTFLGFFFACAITVKTCILVAGGHSVWDLVRIVGTPVYFMMFSGSYLVLLLTSRMALMSEQAINHRENTVLAWGRCALALFDGTVESYAGTCGLNPRSNSSMLHWAAAIFATRGGFGLSFFLVNIGGVVVELRKIFFPSVVLPDGRYDELSAVSMPTSAPEALPRGEKIHVAVAGPLELSDSSSLGETGSCGWTRRDKPPAGASLVPSFFGGSNSHVAKCSDMCRTSSAERSVIFRTNVQNSNSRNGSLFDIYEEI